ncbi:MAG: hypothetical protein AB1545_14950 [Thermodesulfobacteriota bacterium]
MANLECSIEGKLTAIKPFKTKQGQFFEHHITTPADEEYGYPNTVSVVAGRKLGAISDILSITARITGYRKSFISKNGESVVKIDNRLFAV